MPVDDDCGTAGVDSSILTGCGLGSWLGTVAASAAGFGCELDGACAADCLGVEASGVETAGVGCGTGAEISLPCEARLEWIIKTALIANATPRATVRKRNSMR